MTADKILILPIHLFSRTTQINCKENYYLTANPSYIWYLTNSELHKLLWIHKDIQRP